MKKRPLQSGAKSLANMDKTIAETMRFGRPSPMIHHYGSERITEIYNLTAVIYDENPDLPDLPEWLPYSKDDIKKYVSGFLSNSRGDEAYTYGERIKAFPLEGYSNEFLQGLVLAVWQGQSFKYFRKKLNQQNYLLRN